MSPVEASARIEPAPRSRPATGRRPALRTADAPTSRWGRLTGPLRQGNLLGRILTLTIGALFLGVFGVVVFQALLVQGQARLDHVNAQIAAQQEQSKQLHLQVAQLESPERIVTYARNNLHMVDPGDVVYLQQGPGDDAKAATATTVAPAPAPAPTAPATPTTAAKATAPPSPAKTASTAKTAPTTPTTAPASAGPTAPHRP